MTLARFETLLEAYGGSISRWPMADTAQAAVLLSNSAEARAMLGEAQALDRVLDTPATADAARLVMLTDRVVAQAIRDTRRTSGGYAEMPARGDKAGQVIPLPRPGGGAIRQPAQAAKQNVTRGQPFNVPWRAAAALAASLLMGVAVGLTDLAQTTTLNVASLTDASMSEAEIVISAVQYDGLGALDEEQL